MMTSGNMRLFGPNHPRPSLSDIAVEVDSIPQWDTSVKMLVSMANLTVRRTRVITKACEASEKHPYEPSVS